MDSYDFILTSFDLEDYYFVGDYKLTSFSDDSFNCPFIEGEYRVVDGELFRLLDK